MTAAISTTINAGDWVEVRKPNKNRLSTIKNSRWLVQEVNFAKEAIKVTNAKPGEEERTEHFYFNEVTLTSQFQKSDIVQHVEDPRYIGLVVKEGQQIKVKWADGSDDYVRPELINLFTRMVGGEQQILGQYAFKVGDRVVADLKNFEGITFTVRECYPSGMVGLSDSDGFDKSLAGCQLSVISNQASEIETDWGNLKNWQVGDRACYSDSYGESFGTVEQVFSEKLTILWDGRPLSTEYDSSLIREMGIASVTSEEDSEVEEISQVVEESAPAEPSCEIFTTSETLWIDPRTVDTEAGTQTRFREDSQQISLYAEKMAAGEWEWEREPLPELVQDGENFYIVSGHHRIKAALMASGEDDAVQVFCRVTRGTLEDAKLLAIRSSANDYHGVPESRADFRNRVEKFLNILENWDFETEVRELENLKLQPHASEQVVAIDQLLNRIQQGKVEDWSSRIVAAYLRSPRSYRTINSLMATRQAESVFNKVKSELSSGYYIQFQDEEDTRIGQIVFISDASIVVEYLDKITRKAISASSPIDLLRSIEITELKEAEQLTEEPAEEEPEEYTPPPVKKPVQSISQELNGKAKELGLSTSPHQVLPDMSESDRLRNASPHDVDDRLFATPAPTPDVSEYLIGFVSNVPDMNQPQIRRALEAVFEWMESRGQSQNLGYLKTVIDDL